MTKFVVISKNVVYHFLEQSIFLIIILFVLLAIYVPTKQLATVHISDQEEVILRVIATENYFIDVNGKLYEVKQYNDQKEAYVDINVPNEGVLYITPVLKDAVMQENEGIHKVTSMIRLIWEKGKLSSGLVNEGDAVHLRQVAKNRYRLEFEDIEKSK